jgi:hypothetical protein
MGRSKMIRLSGVAKGKRRGKGRGGEGREGKGRRRLEAGGWLLL